MYANALRLLVRREHSRSELGHKLDKRGYHGGDIEAALDRLADEGYLSDARFAELYAEQRVAKGFGPLRVKADLVSRGVDSGQAQHAVDALDADWSGAALNVLLAKCAPSDGYAKLRRTLEQRGFAASAARAAIAEFQGGQR